MTIIQTVTKLFILPFMLMLSLTSNAACQYEADALYQIFKSYREQINTANRIEELTPYFTDAFIRYYETKLLTADSEQEKQRQLTQFWDNLNTAIDIVIIFDYMLHCTKNTAQLELIAALDSDQTDSEQAVQLWRVQVSYKLEHNEWKIHAFEYDKYKNRKDYLATDIKDNFTVIR